MSYNLSRIINNLIINNKDTDDRISQKVQHISSDPTKTFNNSILDMKYKAIINCSTIAELDNTIQQQTVSNLTINERLNRLENNVNNVSRKMWLVSIDGSGLMLQNEGSRNVEFFAWNRTVIMNDWFWIPTFQYPSKFLSWSTPSSPLQHLEGEFNYFLEKNYAIGQVHLIQGYSGYTSYKISCKIKTFFSLSGIFQFGANLPVQVWISCFGTCVDDSTFEDKLCVRDYDLVVDEDNYYKLSYEHNILYKKFITMYISPIKSISFAVKYKFDSNSNAMNVSAYTSFDNETENDYLHVKQQYEYNENILDGITIDDGFPVPTTPIVPSIEIT